MATKDIQADLYNGLHSVVFRNGNHQYYIDGISKPGVTTIMNKTLSKEGLMLWPLNMAIKYLTPLVPHITAEDLREARRTHKKRRDKGADVGTIVHGIVEDMLLKTGTNEVTVWEPNKEVDAAIDAFCSWRSKTKPEVIDVERVVYSHTFEYAGTFDSILKIDGRVYLCDLKTTNASRDAPWGIYAEYFIQLGGYYMAYEEQRQYELAHGDTELVEIDDLLVLSCKKDGKVHTLSASEIGLTLEDCMKMWQNTLHLHNSLGKVKKIVGEHT